MFISKKIILFIILCSLFFISNASSKLDAIIFDCDGVLVDSEYHKFLAWKKSLDKYQINFTIDEYMPMIGESSVAIKKIIEKSKQLSLNEKLIEEKNTFYKQLQKTVLPIESNVHFLKQLAAKKNKLKLKLALVSSAPKEEIYRNLDQLEVKSVFDVIISGEDDLKDIKDPEGTNKPKPYIYQLAIQKLGIDSANAIVLEDTKAGVIAAHDAGLKVLAIPNQYTIHQDFSKATAVIKDINFLIEIIDLVDRGSTIDERIN